MVDIFFSVWLAFFLYVAFEKPARNLCAYFARDASQRLVHINNLNDVEC